MATESQLEYWEKIFSDRAWGRYPPEELVRFIARRFGSTEDKSKIRVLEIGCGPGPNIWFLVREGYHVCGIDGSFTAIEKAKKRLADEGLSFEKTVVDLRVGNFVNFPWPDNYFDAIVDIEALYANSTHDIRTVLKEVLRTLKKGGFFFGKMFGEATTGSDTGTLLEKGTRSHPEIGPCAGNEIAHFFSREEFDDLFSNFEEFSVDYCLRTDAQGQTHIFEWLITAGK